MGGGGGGASTTVNENPLPDWAAPYVKRYLTRANAISKQSIYIYPDDTYAARNQDEIDGIAALADRARDGSSTVNLGITLLVSTLEGNKLSGYPQKDTEWAARATEAYEDFIYEILPKIDTNANMSGGYGGSGHMKVQIIAARKMFNAIVAVAYDIYGRDYFTERKYMTDAISMAEGYAEGSIADTEALRLAGLYEREYQQGLLEDAYRLWLDQQDQTERLLNVMGNAIRAMVGSSVEKTTPFYRPGAISEIAGIALAGASAIGSIYGNIRNPSNQTDTGNNAVSAPAAPASGAQMQA